MDIRQLEAFVGVVDHGSFSAASRALHTVQSNISAHVAHLEAEIGATLIERRSRELTPAGRAVLRRSRSILEEMQAIRDDLAALADRIIGEVSCGSTPTIGRWVLPATLATSASSLPDVNVSVIEAQSDQLTARLASGELDLAITTGTSVVTDRMRGAATREVPLFDEAIVAVVSESHPLHDVGDLTLSQLAEHKLLVPLPDNPLHTHLIEAFDAADAPVREFMEVGSSTLITALAAAEVGVALVPVTALGDPPRGASQRNVSGIAPRRATLIARETARSPTAVQAFSTILEETARAVAATMPGCTVIEPGNDSGAPTH